MKRIAAGGRIGKTEITREERNVAVLLMQAYGDHLNDGVITEDLENG